MAVYTQAQLPIPILSDKAEQNPCAGSSGKVYSEAAIQKARLEKFPKVRSWFKENPQAFGWLEHAFLELAQTAGDGQIGSNTLSYHARFCGLKDASGRRMRRYVPMSNDVNPLISRVLARVHPDMAAKLNLRPCVWDTEELADCVRELASMVA